MTMRKRVPEPGPTHRAKVGQTMGADDKAANSGEKLGGKIKEGVGKLTGNEKMEADGHKDQASGDLKNAGENVKDAFKGDNR